MPRRGAASAALGWLLVAAVLGGCRGGSAVPSRATTTTPTTAASPTPAPEATPTRATPSPTSTPPGPSGPPTPPATAAPAPLAAVGSRGELVVGVQLRLGLAVDGVYGPLTAAAVREFQAARRLPATGAIDAGTWTLLERVPTACPPPAAEPVTRAPGTGRTVALTFDDGASPDVPAILAVLAHFGVHATFFDTGEHDAAYPQYARDITVTGNLLENHTYDHPKNWGYRQYFTEADQRLELTRTSTVQTPVIGHSPCLMRPPGGAYDARSLALARSLGMSLVLWSTSANDWPQPPYLSAGFQRHIIANAEAGAALPHPLILMHAGKASHEPECAPSGCGPGQVSSFRGNTVAALPSVIAFYLTRGYRFVVL